jgi:hypothetical protein
MNTPIVRPSTNRPVPAPAKKGIGNTGRSPIKPCAICNKEFAWTTLEKYGGSICGKCFKSKTCRCKICDVEKKVSDMFIVGQENFCGICYIPTLLSYSVYLILLIYLFFQNFIIFVLVFLLFILIVSDYLGEEQAKASNDNNVLQYFKKAHNYTIGPNNVRRSSMFIVVLAVILCIVLAWTLASPWFLYTVTYERYDQQGEAFTHEYYLGYVRVDIDDSEKIWKEKYLEKNEELNYPWFYNSTSNGAFWLDYGENEDFKHRDYVSSVTLVLGITALAGYVLSIITGFIFYRMTIKLEPNFLYLKNREKFQSQVNSFAKKLENLKYKGIVVSSLNPYLDELGKMSASEDEDITVNNPFNTLYIMILCMLVGISFSASAVFYYAQNWYEAVLADGVDGIWQDSSGWEIMSLPHYFTGDYQISPMLTVLSASIVLGLILAVSHVIFLQRSCYNMVTEIIESSSRTSDFEIPPELIINTEEPLPVEEEEPLTATELPDPGEGLLLDEVVEAEEESVDDEN